MSLPFIKHTLIAVPFVITVGTTANATASPDLEAAPYDLFKAADISGFIGLGGSYNLDGDDSYQNLIESGLQLRVALPANFHVNMQGLYRDYSKQTEQELSLDYATLDWSFNQWLTENTISVGRLKANGGIYSNTRDVPFTRPSIFLARSLYSETYRSLYDNIDGIRFHSEILTDWGDISAELGYGKSEVDENFNTSVLASLPDRSTIDADDSYVFDLRYRTFAISTSFTYRKVAASFAADEDVYDSYQQNETDSGASYSLTNNSSHSTDLSFDSYTFGIQYLRDQVELTVEATQQNIEVALSEDYDLRTNGFYFQGRYFLRPNLAVILRYDWELEDAQAINDNSTSINESTTANRKTEVYTIGTTWNFKENWQFAIEGHRDMNQGDFALAQLAWRF